MRKLAGLKRLKTMELVRIVWMDSAYAPDWRPAGYVALSPITSVGYVTAIHRDAIQICSTLGVDGAALNPLTIPRGAVQSAEVLEAPGGSRAKPRREPRLA